MHPAVGVLVAPAALLLLRLPNITGCLVFSSPFKQIYQGSMNGSDINITVIRHRQQEAGQVSCHGALPAQ
jgi:hypothetical protein